MDPWSIGRRDKGFLVPSTLMPFILYKTRLRLSNSQLKTNQLQKGSVTEVAKLCLEKDEEKVVCNIY